LPIPSPSPDASQESDKKYIPPGERRTRASMTPRILVHSAPGMSGTVKGLAASLGI